MDKKYNIIGVIPARYQSTRFPGKPLAKIGDKTMIRRVYEQVAQSTQLDYFVVATDDQRIVDEIQSFGGNVMLTASNHNNGTERCFEIAQKLPSKYIINIQGDEPFIKPQQIDDLAHCLDGSIEIATLIKKIEDIKTLMDPSEAKVVKNNSDFALYFSRSPIPYFKNFNQDQLFENQKFWKHIGLYAYRTDILKKIIDSHPSMLESIESLEQLRWLENGFSIKLVETYFETMCIETPQDLEKANILIKNFN